MYFNWLERGGSFFPRPYKYVVKSFLPEDKTLECFVIFDGMPNFKIHWEKIERNNIISNRSMFYKRWLYLTSCFRQVLCDLNIWFDIFIIRDLHHVTSNWHYLVSHIFQFLFVIGRRKKLFTLDWKCYLRSTRRKK